MRRIKGVELLKQELLSYQTDVIISIGHELQRISRKVQLTELAFVPFPAELRDEVNAIYLDLNGEPSLETNLDEYAEIELLDYFSNRKINHWDLVYMLELLKAVGGKNGEMPSHCRRLTEFLSYHPEFDIQVCTCGNHERAEGFLVCDLDGNLLADALSPYYWCKRCGRIIEKDKHTVLGINLNPDQY
ncbi:hypothetical protein HDF26_002287 [Pedobacter cryoconitis]|uniref:hypothetical protein n=1 Tax=Pedobacter cryoconitis TaxID=188932 RepID=UPI001611CB17|nr:hypothetical protein [Pedobacter cryoconitis]MBB6271830.1 hypothetical protein [Pedobacter cryoconitis]